MKKYLILISLILVSSCASLGVKSEVINQEKFSNAKRIAIFEGYTEFGDIQTKVINIFQSSLISQYSSNSIIDLQKTKGLFENDVIPLRSPAKFETLVKTNFGNCDQKIAEKIRNKFDCDSFIVLWVYVWDEKSSTEYISGAWTQVLRLYGYSVAQMFDAKDGKEIWHGLWGANEKIVKDNQILFIKLVDENDVKKQLIENMGQKLADYIIDNRKI